MLISRSLYFSQELGSQSTKHLSLSARAMLGNKNDIKAHLLQMVDQIRRNKNKQNKLDIDCNWDLCLRLSDFICLFFILDFCLSVQYRPLSIFFYPRYSSLCETVCICQEIDKRKGNKNEEKCSCRLDNQEGNRVPDVRSRENASEGGFARTITLPFFL